MANQLDEMTGPILEEGKDVNVIAKQIPVKVGWGSAFFQVLVWLPILPGLILLIFGIVKLETLWPLCIIGGLLILFGLGTGAWWISMKIRAGIYLRQLEQKIQHNASQIDNYLENRVVILKNLAQLVSKAVKLDKETYIGISQARSGHFSDTERNEVQAQAEKVAANINIQLERYPELKAHQEIQDAIQQNSYLQREITAAREIYNDTVFQWNRDIQIWPKYMIVAAKNGYTTRIPFIASKEVKEAARGTFFDE